MSSRVGVVIVTHNSSDYIGALLDSIPEALGPIAGRVVVVDSGSTDSTLDLLASRNSCDVVSTSNVGYAAAINIGAAALADVTAILILNPDLELSPGSVPAMVDELERSGAGIVVPQLLAADGSRSNSLRRDPTIARALGLGWTGLRILNETITEPETYLSPTFVDWATGAAMLIDWECFSQLDGWDPTFFLYSEETDFCIRARGAGWGTRYTPAARAVHLGGGSGRSDLLHGMQLISRVRLYGRSHGTLPSAIYFAVSAMAELSWIARRKSGSAVALRMLLFPSERPVELGAGDRLIPR